MKFKVDSGLGLASCCDQVISNWGAKMIIDENTRASNPGEIDVELSRVVSNKPLWPLIFSIPVIVFVCLSIFTESGWLRLLFRFGTGFSLLPLLMFWNYQKDRYTKGDVNIGKVLSTRPALLAVSTNMTTGMDDRRYPVIKIVSGKVPRVDGHSWEAGDYFAAACLYSGPLGKPHWIDFSPSPQSCATGTYEDLKASEDALAYLQEEFELRMSLVPTPDKPGLYFLDEDRLEALKMWGQAGPTEEIASST